MPYPHFELVTKLLDFGRSNGLTAEQQIDVVVNARPELKRTDFKVRTIGG